MSVCELRRATLYDTDAVYALICELKQGQFDRRAFSAGYAANLQDLICTTNWRCSTEKSSA